MNRFGLFLLLGAIAASPAGAAKKQPKYDLATELPPDAHQLHLGDSAPDFSLRGVDDKMYSLADFQAAPILVVAFLSNHCPYSHAAETRLIPLYAQMKSRGVAMVAIQPNSPAGVDVGELGYSKYNDSFAEMKLYARERGFQFPYIDDGATQATAKAYGALCTPEIFIFNQARKLCYLGRLDDSPYAEAATVTISDTRNALEDMIAGRPVKVPATKPFGCSVKWLENKPAIAKANEKWETTPVTVAPIDAAGIQELVRNRTSELRLINVWATWCVPCVEEFPNLVTLIRQLQNRNFELVTVSVDEAADQSKTLAFLQKQHAALPNRVRRVVEDEGRTTDNYRFTGRITALQETLDPAWEGPVPYTLIVAPGGKIVYRHAGPIDLAEVKAKLVEQLGPYYSPLTNN